LIVVADARPVIVLVAASTCLISNVVILLAAQATVVASDTPARPSVKVPAEPAVLVITILVTTVVVAEGTVYSVADDVANAPRASAFEVVAISYYTFPLLVY
jgi:hypothetical protein